MSRKRLQPKELRSERCSNRCSLHKDNIGVEAADAVHGWFEAGLNDDEVLARAAGIDVRLSRGAAARHRRNHLEAVQPEPVKTDNRGLSDVEALEEIIKRGQEFIPTWRITPTEYFKALDLYYKLTKGSAFDGLMSSLAAAANDSEEVEEGTPKPDDPSAGDFDIDE